MKTTEQDLIDTRAAIENLTGQDGAGDILRHHRNRESRLEGILNRQLEELQTALSIARQCSDDETNLSNSIELIETRIANIERVLNGQAKKDLG